MSEGIFFHCKSAPNITLYLPGVIARFKNGRYPASKEQFCSVQEIEAVKSHDMYSKGVIETNEDREKRLTIDPKVERELLKMAMKQLATMPDVVASEPIPSLPPAEDSISEQKQESEQSERMPSLTEANRLKKKQLIELCERLDIEVTEWDTSAILKRKVRAGIKQNAT